MRSNLKLSIEALLVLLLLAVLACTQVEAQAQQNAPPPIQWKGAPEHPDAKRFEYTTSEHHRQFALSMEAYNAGSFDNLPIEMLMPREMYLRKTRYPLEDGSEFLEISIDSTVGYPDWIEWPARIAIQAGVQEHYSAKGELMVRYSEEMPVPAQWNFDDEPYALNHPGLPSFETPSDKELINMGSVEIERRGEIIYWLDDEGTHWTLDPVQKTLQLTRETNRGVATELDAYQHFEDLGFLQTYRIHTLDLNSTPVPIRIIEEEIVLSHSIWQDGSIKADPDFYAQALRLYPNPVKARLNIEWKYGLDIPIHAVIVRRTNGTVLAHEILGGSSIIQISASGWPSGLLLVEIQTDQGVFHRLISKN